MGVCVVCLQGCHMSILLCEAVVGFGRGQVARSLRIGVSAAGLLAIGLAGLPAIAAPIDLGGADLTVAGVTTNVDNYTNTGAAANLIIDFAAGKALLSGAGTIDDAGGGAITVIKRGAGNQNFFTANSYIGGTVLEAGTLRFGNALSFGTGAFTFAVAGTGILSPSGSNRTIGNDIILLGDGIYLNGGVTGRLSGQISGGGQFTFQGNGTAELLNVANTYAGGTVLNAGGVRVAGNGSLGTGAVTVGPATSRFGTVYLNTSVALANDFVLNSQLNIALPNAGQSITLNGAISGASLFFLASGAGTLILPKATTNIGDALLASGFFGVGNNASISGGVGSLTTSGEGGISAYAANLTLNNKVFAGAVFHYDTRGFDLEQAGSVANRIGGSIGSIDKTGAGRLTLSAANTYTGPTTVSQGELSVTGSTASGSAVSVASGATLSGAGLIGGTVFIDNGGIIAPGVGAAPGTLSVASLLLANTSVLNFDLAAPSLAGGGANDFIIVSNDLTLDGTLNINPLAGFAPGVYRLFNYTGALSDHVLAFGSTPAGNSYAIDLSVANQVRLLISPLGIVANYWDGANVIANNAVDGGSGIWNASNTNWTIVTGGANAVWDGTVANFGVTPGTVTVVGTQAFDQLNFAVDGYTLTGDTISGSAVAGIETDAGVTATINNVISGASGLTKTGDGTVVLGGTNTYTGDTNLNAGVLTVAAANALGADANQLNIADGATLRAGDSLVIYQAIALTGVAHIDTGTFLFATPGLVSGNGTLDKVGSGTLFLGNAANSYQGGTIINAGIVSVASNGALGAAAGGITFAGPSTLQTTASISSSRTVALNAAGTINTLGNDDTFSGAISGTGSVTKAGTGTLVLTGTSNYTGTTTVAGGRLTVNGSIANSATTLQTGTSLTGTGTVGALTLLSGSTVSPGNVGVNSGVGNLNVAGPIVFNTGTTYVADILPGSNDRIIVAGTAALNGTLALNVQGSAGNSITPTYLFNATYTVLTSTGLNGTFTTTGLGNFGVAFAPTVSYANNAVTVRLNPASLVTLGGTLTPNQFQVASAFDRAVLAGYNPQPFYPLYVQGAGIPAALTQLDGEIHSAERRVALEDTRIVRETAFDRLNTGSDAAAAGRAATSTTQTTEAETTIWLRGAGSWGTASADGIGQRFTTKQAGVLTGVDYATNGWKIGAAFTYLHNNIDFDALGNSKVESTGGAVYGGYRQDNGFAIGVGGSIAGVSARASRAITIPGLGQVLTSKSEGTVYQGFVEVSYDLASASTARIEPFARFGYASYDAKTFSEAGGIAAVSGVKQNYNQSITQVGLRGGLVTGSATLTASVAYQNVGGDRSPTAQLSIAGLGTTQSIRAVALDKDAVAIEAGASFSIAKRTTLGVSYSGVIGDKNTDHGARATLTVGF